MPSATAPAPWRSLPVPASAPEPGPVPAPSDPGFGVYVHWPFCLSKCPYCDFNAHVRSGVDEPHWRAALVAEIGHYAAEMPGRVVTSIFFGGGTPSLMAPESVAAIIAAIARAWGLSPAVEITLEANPNSAEAARFADYRAAGVNRLSLGVQALDDNDLAFLGRGHSAAEARAAVALAERHFERTSFDLIYARPKQSLAAWRDELHEALEIAGDHLSLYQLTIEEGTAFHRAWRRGSLKPPPDELAARLYEETERICEAAGYTAYEVSNHARPGAECRHNLNCWRSGDYLGVGPGAHGRLTRGSRRYATRQLRRPEAWLGSVEARGHGTEASAPLDRASQAAEMLMMGLRLRQGVSRSGFRRRVGCAIEDVLPAARLEELIDGGFVVFDARALYATAAGRQVLNEVLAELIP